MSSAPYLLSPPLDPQRIIPGPDMSELGAFVRRLTLVLFGMVGLGEGVAYVTGSLEIAALGIPVGALGLWVLWAWPRVTAGGSSRFVMQFAAGSFVVVLVVARLLPPLAPAITLAGLLPVAAGLPYLTGTWLKRLMAAAWTLSLVLGFAAETPSAPSVNPIWATDLLRIASGSALAGLLLFLLWQYRSRLTASARELSGLVTLSRDLADTMDPHLIGERLARHLAQASGATRCAISSWDRSADAVLTYASYPPDLVGTFEPAYRLADYPLTRSVLERKQPVALHVDDPAADVSEAALLRTGGQTALVLLPLVAKGETIGLVELTRAGASFGEREMMLAFTFASEAAMALENARLNQELYFQAFHDPLTRLPNPALFTDRLEHALARGQRLRARLAVLYVDIDNLKTINDRLGHAKGDLVLVAIADRLRLLLRDGDTAARMAGDEFAVLLEDLVDAEEAEVVARRILDVMSQPIPIDDSLVTTGVSIGISGSGSGSGLETADTLMRNVVFAMYQAKALGKGRAEVFRPRMREDASEREALETLLHGAVERDELRVQYQPIVAMETGRIAGTEALVRWDSPERGTLMPGDFIALAEETGLIVPIGRWVLQEACRQTRAWQDLRGRGDLSISVNLSARQFQHPALRSDILAALASTGLDASSLVIEITESILMLHTPSTMATLEALRKLGVRVAVDDFGTGYSSLAYLQRFPVDIVKVDRTFVEHAADGGDGAVLARAIVDLARALRLGSWPRASRSSSSWRRCCPSAAGKGRVTSSRGPSTPGTLETMLTVSAAAMGSPVGAHPGGGRSRTIRALRNQKRAGRGMPEVDRGRLSALLAAEEARFRATHPASVALHERASRSLLGGVPMNWMVRWAGRVPVFVREASGAHFVDVDGHEYVDLCLGDTGAMAGHGPQATLAAIADQLPRGLTTMLPTEDAAPVGEEMARRFGLPYWQFTLTATDANRFAIRLARHITRRPKILVYDWCYHGTVDETFITLRPDGTAGPRPGSIGPPVDPNLTTRVVDWNDLEALDAALAHDDVACVPGGAGHDEHRHRASGARLPRGAPRPDAPPRSAADHRRDAHHLRRPRRLHRRRRTRAGPARDRQDDRRRHPGRRVRLHGRGSLAYHLRDDDRRRRCRRDRRHSRRERSLARGDARHPRSRPDRRGVRAHDPACETVGGGCGCRHRGERRAVARVAPWLPRRICVPTDAAAHRP